MDEERLLEKQKPIKKNMFVKVVCYICCFSGLFLGWGPPIFSFIFVEIRYRLIDTEKYDRSWYESLRIQLFTVVVVYVFVTIMMYY